MSRQTWDSQSHHRHFQLKQAIEPTAENRDGRFAPHPDLIDFVGLGDAGGRDDKVVGSVFSLALGRQWAVQQGPGSNRVKGVQGGGKLFCETPRESEYGTSRKSLFNFRNR